MTERFCSSFKESRSRFNILIPCFCTIPSQSTDRTTSHAAGFYLSFYPRDAMLARVIAIATCLSVRLSVCLSVTRRYCVKTKKASGMISSPSVSSKTLVFRRQISSPNSKGFFRTGASNKGRSEKFSDFYPRDAMLARVIAIATCLSVCHGQNEES